MNTTHLFVELLVIGVGAALAVALAIAALLGMAPADLLLDLGQQPSVWLTLLPLLSVVYVLGIVVDRIADWAFHRWDAKHREEFFPGQRNRYYDDRRTLVVFGPRLWDHLEYGRSRLRICRGWSVNALALLVAVDVLAVTGSMEVSGYRLAVSNFFLLALAALCIACWRSLSRTEYGKIERQSEWLRRVTEREL